LSFIFRAAFANTPSLMSFWMRMRVRGFRHCLNAMEGGNTNFAGAKISEDSTCEWGVSW
jgi:hypothetical protein